MENPDLQKLRDALNFGGILEGLKFLNSRVPHRFTAIYRIEGTNLRLIHFYDRQQEPEPLSLLKVVPLKDSLCHFAIRDGSLKTSDAPSDPKLSHAAMREVMISYVGLPLTRASGELLGTFCHFDFVQHQVPDDEMEFLASAMPLLTGYIAA